MSLKSNFYLDISPKEWEDCKYCMVESKGLQFILKKEHRSKFFSWVKRAKDPAYRQRIQNFIDQMEQHENEKGRTPETN